MAAHSILFGVARFNPSPVRLALTRFKTILQVIAMAGNPN
jgi:hypothetical protein